MPTTASSYTLVTWRASQKVKMARLITSDTINNEARKSCMIYWLTVAVYDTCVSIVVVFVFSFITIS